MEKIYNIHAHWASGWVKGTNIMGGKLHISDDHFWMYDFRPYKVEINYENIDKIIYANLPIFSYVLVVVKKKTVHDTDIMILIHPKKILHYFQDYGIRCIQSHRSYFIGFRSSELDKM